MARSITLWLISLAFAQDGSDLWGDDVKNYSSPNFHPGPCYFNRNAAHKI
jgi:hypothetical protein